VIRRALAAAMVTAAAIAAAAGPAGAIETGDFGLVPASGARQSLHETVRPGRTTEDDVRVFNKTAQPLKLRVSVERTSVAGDGTLQLSGGGGEADWVSMSAREVQLAPRGSAVVHVTIRPPSTAPKETVRLAVVAEPVLDHPTSVVQRLAMVAYLEPARRSPLRASLGALPFVALALLVFALRNLAAGARLRRRLRWQQRRRQRVHGSPPVYPGARRPVGG
jgi:hypothetical protein